MRVLPAIALMICGLGGWGVFLLLSSNAQTARRRLLGMALVGFAILLAAISFPHSASLLIATRAFAPGAFDYILGFCLPAIAVITFAIMTITGRDSKYGIIGFGLLVCTSSSMFITQGALVPALANLILSAGTICTTLSVIAVTQDSRESSETKTTSQGTLPACLAGALTLATLVAAIRSTLINSPPTVETASSSTLGTALLVDHGVSLVLSGVLLLVTVVALMLLSKGKLVLQDTHGPMD